MQHNNEQEGGVLNPVAILRSGLTTLSVLVKSTRDGRVYFGILSGKNWECDSWTEDPGVIDVLVLKHGFLLLPEDAPPLRSDHLEEDIAALTQWIAYQQKTRKRKSLKFPKRKK